MKLEGFFRAFYYSPSKWNRWTLLAIFLFVNFIATWVYFGWSSLAAMLFEDQVYSWLCEKDASGKFINDQRLTDHLFICDRQDIMVQSLFTFSMIGHLAGPPVAGIILDSLGVKVPVIAGSILNAIGWTFIASSSPTFNLYHAGFLLFAMGQDLICLPPMRITILFPRYRATVAAVMGAASSASPFVASIMYFIKKWSNMNHKTISLGYVFFVAIPVMIFSMYGFPSNFEAYEKKTDSPSTSKLAKAEIQSPNPKPKSPYEIEMCADPLPAPKVTPWYKPDTERLKLLLSHACSSGYIIVGILFALIAESAATIYQPAALRTVSKPVIILLDILIPLSFVPCIIMGRLADIIGPAIILAFISLAGLLSMVLLIPSSPLFHYMSTVAYFIFISFLETGIYCFLDSTIPKECFGKLFGFSICLSGIAGILSFFVYNNIGVQRLGGNLASLFVFYAGSLGFLACLLLYLAISQRARNKKLRTSWPANRQKEPAPTVFT